ncbi:MAG: HAD hydrolase-like protein [Verrucomicrobiae bacterium]|nr:HAD hydrolase-like protein [Verrucomicrobiae bacterium]
MKQPNKLLLWDIDGTLLTTGSAGEYALIQALKNHFEIDSKLEGIEIAGRTDKGIAMEILRKYNLPETLENITRFLDGYIEELQHWLPKRQETGRVLEGIATILERAHQRNDLAQGLLTGNLQRGAQLKLEHYQMMHYFEFGAFSDDHHDRNQLPAYAKQRAEEKFQTNFSPENIFVIGDTPHDIACGKAIGAKTIAVATGRFTLKELKKHQPTATFQDLTNFQEFFAIIDTVS